MIVYRPQERVIATAGLISEISGLEAVQDLLIRFGEFEAGVTDARPELGDVLRRAAVALGRLFCRDTSEARQRFRSAWAEVRSLSLPREIRVSVPEGYAFYGLYPQSYIDSARRFFADSRPRDVCVVGIRSIGTGLSAVVAGTLEELGCRVNSYTVRPTGHPFDRRLDVELPQDAEYFAVVDEGPGLSGSSFVCVAEQFPRERVVLFPSWEGDADRFVNERARAVWPQYRKYWTSYEPSWLKGIDLSGGKWRDLLGVDVAVQPQHEARKFLDGSTLYKFAGLGSYGRERFERAQVLGEAGYSPKARELRDGFIGFDFVVGTCGHTLPVRSRSVARSGDTARMSACATVIPEYLAFRRAEFPASRSIGFDSLAEMVQVNAGIDVGEFRSEFEDRPAVAVDGRMMPHEWIETADGWLKTDSTDHCCDHFFSGYADIAWDLAGAAAEFEMTPEERDVLVRRYSAASGDRLSEALIHFYEIAYLAFRLGYVTMAAEATSRTPDHERFQTLKRKYRSSIAERQQVIA